MIRTTITIFSLAFATAWFLWSQLHWHHLKARNVELELRSQFFSSTCKETITRNQKLQTVNTYLAESLEAISHNRPGRKKYLVQLKKLIKDRNIQYGIGGGL